MLNFGQHTLIACVSVRAFAMTFIHVFAKVPLSCLLLLSELALLGICVQISVFKNSSPMRRIDQWTRVLAIRHFVFQLKTLNGNTFSFKWFYSMFHHSRVVA